MQENRIVRGVDALILAVKASGGYKYRAMMQMQDGQELDTFITQAEVRLRFMAHSLAVAEAMLREPAPSIHPRWEEYQRRQAEALQEMMKKKDGNSKTPIRLRAVAKTREGPTESIERPDRAGIVPTEPADEPGGNLPV
jgi:hypothetical protein